jgi:FkbM family methyltransferase
MPKRGLIMGGFPQRLLRLVFNLFVLISARPIFQRINEKIFRVIVSSLGYMNFSEDFKMTGEKSLFRSIDSQEINKILDIGANEGQWASMALKETTAKIISFEPQSIPFATLIQLCEKHPERMRAYQIALSNKDFETKINILENSTGLSYLDDEIKSHPLINGKSNSQEPIKAWSLDTFFEHNTSELLNVDFVKIDTEGHEFEVLIGARRYLDAVKPKYIQIEMNHHQLFKNKSLFEFSKLLPNYRIYQLLPFGNSLHQINPLDPARNLFMLANFLFIKE